MSGLWQILQQSKGGTLEHFIVGSAPYVAAADPAPTVTLYGPSGVGELVASQAATRGPVTTLDDTAEAGDTTIPLTAITDLVVGRQYIIGPSAGLAQYEFVTIAGISSSAGTVTVRDELLFDYASGDAFSSHRLSVTIDADEVPNVRRGCLARWSYTANGQAFTEDTPFTVSKFGPQCPLTRQDILLRHAQAENHLGARQTIDDLIKAMWDEQLSDMAMRVDPGAIVSGVSLKRAMLYRVLADIPVANDDQEERDRYFEKYEAEWERVLQSAPLDVDGDGDVDSDDFVEPANVARLWRA